MPKLCRCGKIGDGSCCSRQSQQRRSTTSEGHGSDHRKASESYRAEFPVCERCVMLYGAVDAQIAVDMHHIVAVKDAPHLRMDPGNWLALCRRCHELLEGEIIDGMKVKRWSEAHYKTSVDGGAHLPGVGKMWQQDAQRSLVIARTNLAKNGVRPCQEHH